MQAITGTGEAPAYAFVPTEVNGYAPPVPEYAAWSMPERIARARQLLRDAGLDKVGDPHRQHPGLAAAGAREDQERTVAVRDSLPLGRVQALQQGFYGGHG